MAVLSAGARPSWTGARLARPARDLARSVRFYRDLVGLPLVGGFTGHAGYDGVFFGLPGGGELELTAGPVRPAPPTEEDLLVLYLDTYREVESTGARLSAAGVARVASPNPYWNRTGQTYLDPDGYRVVLAAVDPGGGTIPPAELGRRGCATLLASWEEYARGARGAAVRRFPGVAAAVFPEGFERSVYNNALLGRGLDAGARAAAIAAMEGAYAAAGVTRFAAWTHESDDAMRDELDSRGYLLDTTTRAMGMSLDEIRLPRPSIEIWPATWSDYLRFEGLPRDFLATADHALLHVLTIRLDGDIVAAALAYDRCGDCGIFNVGTAERARRRGFGTALTVAQLHDARARGCTTASLQSTPTAERVYAATGFRDLGRILEYVPREP